MTCSGETELLPGLVAGVAMATRHGCQSPPPAELPQLIRRYDNHISNKRVAWCSAQSWHRARSLSLSMLSHLREWREGKWILAERQPRLLRRNNSRLQHTSLHSRSIEEIKKSCFIPVYFSPFYCHCVFHKTIPIHSFILFLLDIRLCYICHITKFADQYSKNIDTIWIRRRRQLYSPAYISHLFEHFYFI